MRIGIALILAGLLVMVATPATTTGSLRAYIEGKVEERADWFHWGTLGTSEPELKLELRGTKSQGNIVKYEWDFGDDSTAEGEYVTHTYYSGNWNITLTVHDKRGRSASETLKIEVRGGKPKVVQQEEPDIEERIKEKEELKKAENKKLEKEKNFAWNPKERQIFTVSGERWVIEHDEFDEFAKEIRKVLPRANSWGTSLSLLYLVKETLGTIKSSHTIFMIRPEYLYHFEELEAEYPDLLPVSTEKLESYLKTYGYPLLYFSYDYTGMLRGVIIAKKVDTTLAKLLVEKPIPLDTLLQYENEELKKAEKSQKKVKKTFTWNPKDLKERLIITVTARPRVNNYDEFAEEIRKVISTLNLWGAPSLLYWEGIKVEGETTRLDIIRSHHTIFMVSPENLSDFEKLETKYPDLLPIPTEKLESYLKTYSYPLLYFSYDYTGVLRGIIIAKKVDTTLAKLLVEKPIPLDTSLQYKNGKLEKLEK